MLPIILLWLLNIPYPTGRLARWALYLSNYQIYIVHRKGNLYTNMDVLSRPVFLVYPKLDTPKSIEQDSTDKHLDVHEDEVLKQFTTIGKNTSLDVVHVTLQTH